MEESEKQVRGSSVDFSQQPRSLSDFDAKSRTSQPPSELSDLDDALIEMCELGAEVQSIEEAQETIANAQQQVMNLRLGMSHLHAILSDIERRLGATRLVSQQNARQLDA